ncbi:MAG: ABC transporter ATP-binding protein [Chitinophagales bacterium]
MWRNSFWDKYLIDVSALQRGRKIYAFLLPYKWQFSAGVLCLLITTGLLLYIPVAVRQLIDSANTTAASMQHLTATGAVVAVLFLLQAFFTFLRIWLFETISQRTLADIRDALLKKIIHQPISFFEQHRIADLNARLTADVNQLQDALAGSLSTLIQNLVTPLVCIPILFTISVPLATYTLIFFPFLVFGLELFGRQVRILAKQSQDALGTASVISEEAMQAADLIKFFGTEQYEHQRYHDALTNAVRIGLRTARVKALFMGVVIVAMAGGCVGLMHYGLTQVSQGNMTIGTLLSFLVFLFFAASAAGGLIEGYASLQRTIGASSRLVDLLELPAYATSDDHQAVVPDDPHISFQNVCFEYPMRSQKVLQEVTLEIPFGQHVALVGASGAGKSTLIKLLLGLYFPQKGSIYINNIDTRLLNLTSWRKQIGIVPQDVFLFGGTIAENIAYGWPDADSAQIAWAAEQANIASFIAGLPQGYNTKVGERGITLSGGQKQRIAIARAMIRNPKILILDEATSSLDINSEKLIQDALRHCAQGRTMITIAHRISTIRDADRIIVLRQGQIEANGSFRDLLEGHSEYSHFIRSYQQTWI